MFINMLQHDQSSVQIRRNFNNAFDTSLPAQLAHAVSAQDFERCMARINEVAITFDPRAFQQRMQCMMVASALFFFALFGIMGPVLGNMWVGSGGGFPFMILLIPIMICFIGCPMFIASQAQKRLASEARRLDTACQQQNSVVRGVAFSEEAIATGVAVSRRRAQMSSEIMIIVRPTAGGGAPVVPGPPVVVSGVPTAAASVFSGVPTAAVTYPTAVTTYPAASVAMEMPVQPLSGTPVAQGGMVEQLTQLNQLRQAGALTETEFENAKARLLAKV